MPIDISAIRTLLAQAIGIQELDLPNLSRAVVGVPNGVNLQSLEKFQDKPERIRGAATIHDYAGFVEYVNSFKGGGSRIFVNPEAKFSEGTTLATCYFDYPAPGAPSWTTHSAVLRVQPSLEYKKLLEIDGKLLDQAAFAKRVNDLDKIITSMSGADLLELARSLTLASTGDFKSFEDDLSGTTHLVYDVKVRASAGTAEKKIDVPASFGFHLPILLNGDSFNVLADFRYRLPESAGGKIMLGVALPDRIYLERDVLEQAVSKLAKDTSLPVIIGESNVPEPDADLD